MATNREKAEDLRKLAAEIRARAREPGMPGYNEKMEKAAAELERAAAEIKPQHP